MFKSVEYMPLWISFLRHLFLSSMHKKMVLLLINGIVWKKIEQCEKHCDWINAPLDICSQSSVYL